ncbi:hypothetical protein SJAG_06600 [Schizosaccharomyces japonicus yFS275]|uniref:Secreted protein n=1 Tax=Schizosaccharomyces japonicus (strain yFS275 / FY16936) TaxID=402676 RepID=T0S122_SCHJY|nr:hypothetical protein SJAG_06600 [Schizosaccharomyces japonicus yFS275]EQC53012.1 hypothetical protein SJAG_06600 [Schizosaccharomyces japonicus yFS275]
MNCHFCFLVIARCGVIKLRIILSLYCSGEGGEEIYYCKEPFQTPVFFRTGRFSLSPQKQSNQVFSTKSQRRNLVSAVRGRGVVAGHYDHSLFSSCVQRTCKTYRTFGSFIESESGA